MKIQKLERHRYASELNKIHLEDGTVLKAPHVTDMLAANIFLESATRSYVVRLTCRSGEYEKGIRHLVKATSEKHAMNIALRDECHCDDAELISEGCMEDAHGEWIYEADGAKVIAKDHAAIVEQYWNLY